MTRAWLFSLLALPLLATDPTILVGPKGRVRVKGTSKDAVIVELLDQRNQLFVLIGQLTEQVTQCQANEEPSRRISQHTDLDRWTDWVERQKYEAEAHKHDGHAMDVATAQQFDADLAALDAALHAFSRKLHTGGTLPADDWKKLVKRATQFSSCKSK